MPVSRAMGPAAAMRARVRVTREALLNMVVGGLASVRMKRCVEARKQENLLKI